MINEPPFNLTSEYDRWVEKKQEEKVLDEYFGGEVEDGKKLETY